MKILHIVPALTIGGAQRIATLLARGLASLGHTVVVVALAEPLGSWLEADLRAGEVRLCFLGHKRARRLRTILRLRRVLADFKPDVVHTHLDTLQYALPALVAGRRVAVVHTIHNVAEHDATRLTRVFNGIAFWRGVVPVAVGDAVAASIRRVYEIPVRHSISNAIPVADYRGSSDSREEVRIQLGIPLDAAVFLSVGRLCEQKNHAGLLRAFRSPTLRAKRAHLLIAGEGKLRNALKRQAACSGMNDRVHFLGLRRDVSRLAGASDAFVLSSSFEGNPLVVMEAMAASLPVVATAVGSVPELVSEQTGYLVPPGDERALAGALEVLAGDLGLARELGAAGAAVAQERFDALAMVRAYERLYVEETTSVRFAA